MRSSTRVAASYASVRISSASRWALRSTSAARVCAASMIDRTWSVTIAPPARSAASAARESSSCRTNVLRFRHAYLPPLSPGRRRGGTARTAHCRRLVVLPRVGLDPPPQAGGIRRRASAAQGHGDRAELRPLPAPPPGRGFPSTTTSPVRAPAVGRSRGRWTATTSTSSSAGVRRGAGALGGPAGPLIKRSPAQSDPGRDPPAAARSAARRTPALGACPPPRAPERAGARAAAC